MKILNVPIFVNFESLHLLIKCSVVNFEWLNLLINLISCKFWMSSTFFINVLNCKLFKADFIGGATLRFIDVKSKPCHSFSFWMLTLNLKIFLEPLFFIANQFQYNKFIFANIVPLKQEQTISVVTELIRYKPVRWVSC